MKNTNQDAIYNIAKDRKELSKNMRFYVYYVDYKNVFTLVCDNEDDLYRAICRATITDSHLFHVLDLKTKETFYLLSDDVWRYGGIIAYRQKIKNKKIFRKE
jgi:hypothetical protein